MYYYNRCIFILIYSCLCVHLHKFAYIHNAFVHNVFVHIFKWYACYKAYVVLQNRNLPKEKPVLVLPYKVVVMDIKMKATEAKVFTLFSEQ